MKIRGLVLALSIVCILAGCSGGGLLKSANIQHETWESVMSFSGSGDATSRVFAVSGGDDRIFFSLKRDDGNHFAIYLAQAGKDLEKEGYIKRFDMSSPTTKRFSVPAGKYYLKIISGEDSEWSVSIDEYR